MKHKRHKQHVQPPAPQAQAAPAQSYTGLKILAGLAGILIAVAILVFAMTDSDATTTQTAGGQVPTNAAPRAGSPSVPSGDVQEVRMAVKGFSYAPSSLTVQAGRPVRWIVDGSQSSGCTSQLVFREFGISRRLVKGENIIEFTPTKKGTFQFTCGMNMVKGTMTVV